MLHESEGLAFRLAQVLYQRHRPVRVEGDKNEVEQLAAAGGNSVRTWSTDGVGKLLDEAHALGLTVTVEQAPFEPEPGAYGGSADGHGHGHHHHHGDDHDHHHHH